MKSFLDLLEKTCSRQPAKFEWQLKEFGSFYDEKDYYPFRLEAKPDAVLDAVVAEQLPWDSPRGPPNRKSNAIRLESSHLIAQFNFSKPNQIDSLMNTLLLLVVMVLMVTFSLVLSNSVS